MNKKYAVVKNGVVDNVILWDKEIHPSYDVDGEAIDLPTLPKLAQDDEGNDIEVSWSPQAGDKYIDGEFVQVPRAPRETGLHEPPNQFYPSI